MTLAPFIAALAVVIIMTRPVPATEQMTRPVPERLSGADARILGVAPQVIEPGQTVRIILSEPVFEGNDPSEVARRLSIQIGKRQAEILDVAADTITVSAPRSLPRDQLLGVEILGMGLKLETALGQGVVVQTLSFVALLRNPVLWAIGAAAAVLALGAGWILWLRRRRERALLGQVESLRFRLERHEVPLPVDAPAQPESGVPSASSASPPVPLPEVPAGLIDAINRGECTLFWGGGLSAQAGYPTWRQALSEMIERTAPNEGTSGADLQQSLNAGRFSLIVEVLATRLGREAVLRELVRLWGAPRDTTPAIDALARLRFTNVVTSVWDPLIDQAFAHRHPVVVTGVSSESLQPLLSREAFCIVRLWGALTRPESVLFTPNEYRGAVAGNLTYAKYLASLALSQSHLFVGASVDTIEEYLSATPRNTSSRTHYALVADNNAIALSREVFKNRYGVELLVFRPTPGWPELPAFVSNLAQAVAAHAPATPPVGIEAFRLVTVKLENIGPFKRLSLDLDQGWNVLLGNNGSGKSTVLRAIALVLCGDDSRALIEGSRLLQTGATSGAVELTVGRDTYRTELTRDTTTGAVHVNVGTRVSPLKAGRWVALAFPPLRGISIDNPKGPTADGSPAPVVEDVLPILAGQTDARLSSLKQWLVNLDVRSTPGEGVSKKDADENRRLRDHFFDVFNAFVPGANVKFASVDRKSWQVNVTTNGIEVGIDQVSQGTSSMLGWVGAVLQRMYEIYGAGKDIKRQAAVVLIDEIDAHLHPEWQQQIVTALKEQFPRVQFIATTHSPLIVGELEPAQVYRMRWDGTEVVADHPTQPIKGMGVAGLLTSEMFGLTSTVDQATQDLLEEQRTLSGGDEALSEDQKAKLEEVNKKLESLGFRYQVRDPEFTEYLKQRHQRAREEAGPEPPEGATRTAFNPRVKDLVKAAVARATGRREEGQP